MSTSTVSRIVNGGRTAGRWLLAVLCVLVMAFAISAAQPRDAWAGGGFENCGENLSTEYGGDPLQLYIQAIDPSKPATMYGWEISDPKPWDSISEEVVTINLDPSVDTVGASAFYGFTNLETVYIPSTLERIGNQAFGNCPNLKKVFWDGTDAQWQAFINSGSFVGTGNEALTDNPNLTVCYWGDCSDKSSPDNHVIWGFDTTTQTFVVRGTGEMKDYGSEDSRDWDGYRDKIKHVEVRDGVTCIGKNAFAKCTELQDVKLYQIEHLSVLNYIRNFAFYQCTKLASVELPSSVTKLGGGSFEYCAELKSAVIPNKDVEIKEAWGSYPFEHCSDDLVITGYPLKSPGPNSLPTYCRDKVILFDAIGGDKGAYTADLAGSKSAAVKDDYLLTAFVESLLANPKLTMPVAPGVVDLDGNGKNDIAIDAAPSGDWVLTRAATCNILPRYTFKLSKQQRLQAARDSGTGFYYSGFNIRLNTVSLSDATVTVPAQTYTYTGKALKPAATVKAVGKTLKAGTDYTVSYSNNKNAGTAKITITGKGGDYVGTKTVTFKIAKAKSSAKAKKSTVSVKYAKVKKKAQTVANLTVKCDKGKASYKSASSGKAKKFKVNKKTGKVTVPKGTKKGTYKVKVKVTVKAGTNYTKLTKTVSFKVKVS